jgi:SAM-dependent methyltransferase
MTYDVFENYSEEYDRWFDEHRDEFHAEMARIREVFPQPDSRSLEVGTGSGRFAASLGISVGVEPSRALGRMARNRGIEIIRGEAESLPLKSDSCSSLLLVTVICFLDYPERAFREFHRVLVPSGVLAVAFIERGGPIHEKYIKDGEKGRFLSHARFFSPGEVVMLLEDTGFRVANITVRAGFGIILAQKDKKTAGTSFAL